MEFHEKFKNDGLAVLMLSTEDKGTVEKFVAANKIPYTVAVSKESELEPFKIEGYPSAFLIDGSGKILWEGHPAMMTAAALQAALKTLDRVSIGAVAPALAPAKADFEKGKFGDAAKKAQTVQAGKSAPEADKA